MKHLFPTLSSRWLTLPVAIFMAITALPLHGQPHPDDYTRLLTADERESAEYTISIIGNDLASRKGGTRVLSATNRLLNNEESQLWTNGICVYETVYDEEERAVLFSPVLRTNDIEGIIHLEPLKVKGRNIVMADRPDVKITVEQIAGHTLLVGRNAQGKPVMVLHSITRDQLNDDSWPALALFPIMGKYALPGGEYAILGPKMDFYTDVDSDTDPGCPVALYVNRDFKSINILYGAGRVSRGNPNSPKWGKMPGGGGAGAIMGPMEWKITPTVDGLQAIVIHDEPFVFHNPAIGNDGDTAMFTLVQGPYDGLPGKWAAASVIPLTVEVLKLFPNEILKLMRGEIYARHGDTFKDPDTQRYFDAQPWYHRSGGRITLTDVERLNYALITHVMSIPR